MTGEIIKSFLVGLGFAVDDSSLAKFNKSIAGAALKITALYGAIKLAAAGIFASIAKISEGFEQMGYEYRLIAPAINKAIILRRELLKAYSAAGINILQAVQNSIKFNYALAKTKFTLEAIYKSVGAKFLPLLTKQLDIFRGKLLANMPKIKAALEGFIIVIFKAFAATVELGERLWSILGRVWDFFKQLDEATNGWSTKILLAIAAWKLLNLEFLATPLGMVLAGLLAILALYDDFKVWQEGGKSFFNWAPFVPVINAVTTAIKALKEGLGDAFMILFDWYGILKDILTLNFGALKYDFQNIFSDVGKYVGDAVQYFKDLLQVAQSLINWAPAAGHFLGGLFGGNGGSNLNAINNPPPLYPTGGTSSQQTIRQETNINVHGSPDAQATGQTVVGEQRRVNMDLARNLKGAAM